MLKSDYIRRINLLCRPSALKSSAMALAMKQLSARPLAARAGKVLPKLSIGRCVRVSASAKPQDQVRVPPRRQQGRSSAPQRPSCTRSVNTPSRGPSAAPDLRHLS